MQASDPHDLGGHLATPTDCWCSSWTTSTGSVNETVYVLDGAVEWSAYKVCAGRGLKLRSKGVALKATEQSVDTSSAAGKAFFDMLGVFAEFETNLRRERQLEGIKAAKAKGIYKGRKPSIDPAQVRRLLEVEGLGPSAIARRLGIGRASVYRVLAGKGGSDPVTTDARST